MKYLCCLLVTLFVLTGCSSSDSMDEAMELRQKINQDQFEFDAEITADYGDIQHRFSLHCQVDEQGNVTFSVLSPESIAGITGVISHSEGKLTFDDKAVAFELLAQGQLSPVSGPWIMVKALRGGYMSSCCEENGVYHLSIDDSYESDSLHLEVWFDEEGCVICAQIFWQNRMLLSMDIENFVYV